MRGLENAVNCTCGQKLRIGESYIEALNPQTNIWDRYYPEFRLYRTNQEILTLFANDGRQLTFEAGCENTINGVSYPDFNDLEQAITTNIVNFFFSLISFQWLGGTTANRPTGAKLKIYLMYYDTDLGYPIWWNGAYWTNATGAIV